MKLGIFPPAVVFSLAMLVYGTAELAAQSTQVPDGVPAHMVVTVEAHHGSNVPVINREDVMVYEGHDRDKVIDWVPAQGEHPGLELFVLLDDGSSASLGTQLGDIRKFINSQPASTKIGVAYMQDGVAHIEQNLTTDHALAAKALRLPKGISGVNGSPYFSLSDLIKKWPESDSRREVFMATDGIDRYYDSADLLDPYLAAAIEDAQKAGVLVYAIYTPGVGHYSHSYWRSYWGQLYLARLTDETGGESYYIGFTGPPVAFAPFLADAADRWNHQYLLTFLAKPPKKAGLQPVKVRTEVPNAELVSADKVYVPAAR
jgi:hypothetical protein